MTEAFVPTLIFNLSKKQKSEHSLRTLERTKKSKNTFFDSLAIFKAKITTVGAAHN